MDLNLILVLRSLLELLVYCALGGWPRAARLALKGFLEIVIVYLDQVLLTLEIILGGVQVGHGSLPPSLHRQILNLFELHRFLALGVQLEISVVCTTPKCRLTLTSAVLL